MKLTNPSTSQLIKVHTKVRNTSTVKHKTCSCKIPLYNKHFKLTTSKFLSTAADYKPSHVSIGPFVP